MSHDAVDVDIDIDIAGIMSVLLPPLIADIIAARRMARRNLIVDNTKRTRGGRSRQWWISSWCWDFCVRAMILM